MSTQIAYDSDTFVIPAWTFADRLRKARSMTGLGQKDFAERIGVKSSAYAQWEADNNQPRNIVEVVTRIEDLTRIPASWLLGLDERAQKKAPTANGGGLSLVHPPGLEPGTHWIRDSRRAKPMRPRGRADRSTGPKGRAR